MVKLEMGLHVPQSKWSVEVVVDYTYERVEPLTLPHSSP